MHRTARVQSLDRGLAIIEALARRRPTGRTVLHIRRDGPGRCREDAGRAPSSSRTNTQPRAHPSTPITIGMSNMLTQPPRRGTLSANPQGSVGDPAPATSHSSASATAIQ